MRYLLCENANSNTEKMEHVMAIAAGVFMGSPSRNVFTTCDTCEALWLSRVNVSNGICFVCSTAICHECSFSRLYVVHGTTNPIPCVVCKRCSDHWTAKSTEGVRSKCDPCVSIMTVTEFTDHVQSMSQ